MELDKLQKDSQEWREKSFPPEHRTVEYKRWASVKRRVS
jgi:hypothetical protein